MKPREFTEEFKPEAVRILATSSRSISSVADDLGIGKSTLDRWRRNFAEQDLLSGPHEDMSQELARLRKEKELLRQERDLLKKATALLRSGDKSMRFAFTTWRKPTCLCRDYVLSRASASAVTMPGSIACPVAAWRD